MINNFEVVRQEDITDCGACCLKMIIKYYGGDYPLFHLKQLTHTVVVKHFCNTWD